MKWVVDMTIGYPGQKPLDFFNVTFANRPPCKTTIHYRIYSASDVSNSGGGGSGSGIGIDSCNDSFCSLVVVVIILEIVYIISIIYNYLNLSS